MYFISQEVLTCEVYTTVQVLCCQPSQHIHSEANIFFSHPFAQVSLRVWEHSQTKVKNLRRLLLFITSECTVRLPRIIN
jgi:hypothetical protein